MIPQPISEILDDDYRRTETSGGIQYCLPFHNVCCRASVRVIDYYPHNLEDFSVRCERFTQENLSASGDSAFEYDREPQEAGREEWEWRFYLLVEDGSSTEENILDEKSKKRLRVLVAHHDAEFLLKIDPTE